MNSDNSNKVNTNIYLDTNIIKENIKINTLIHNDVLFTFKKINSQINDYNIHHISGEIGSTPLVDTLNNFIKTFSNKNPCSNSFIIENGIFINAITGCASHLTHIVFDFRSLIGIFYDILKKNPDFYIIYELIIPIYFNTYQVINDNDIELTLNNMDIIKKFLKDIGLDNKIIFISNINKIYNIDYETIFIKNLHYSEFKSMKETNNFVLSSRIYRNINNETFSDLLRRIFLDKYGALPNKYFILEKRTSSSYYDNVRGINENGFIILKKICTDFCIKNNLELIIWDNDFVNKHSLYEQYLISYQSEVIVSFAGSQQLFSSTINNGLVIIIGGISEKCLENFPLCRNYIFYLTTYDQFTNPNIHLFFDQYTIRNDGNDNKIRIEMIKEILLYYEKMITNKQNSNNKELKIWKKTGKYLLDVDNYKNLNSILKSKNIIEDNDNYLVVKNLYSINNTSLIYNDETVIASNFLCNDTINIIKEKELIIPDIVLYNDLINKKSQKTLEINDLCLNLIRFQNCNYFHFLLETLPYLVCCFKKNSSLYTINKNFSVVINNDFNNIISSLFDINLISKISSYDVILFKNCIIPKNLNTNHYICWTKYGQKQNNDYFYYDKEGLILTREFIFEKFNINPMKKKKLIISRQSQVNSGRCNDTNIILENNMFVDYEKIFPGNSTFHQQVSIFSQASVIIMEAGAAVANLLFVPKNCLVFIMYTNSNFTNPKLFDIFKLVSGAKIHNIPCEAVINMNNLFAKNIEYYLKKSHGFSSHPYNLTFKVSQLEVKKIENIIKHYQRKNIVIFGTGKISEVAYYFLKNDTTHNIVAFTLEKDFIKNETTKFDLPIVPFEEIENIYNPDDYLLFAPCTGTNLNKFRERIYNRGKQKGYNFYTYISSKANVFTENIGENCFILDDNNIQPYTKIGNNCVLWSGNHIGHHSTIEDHVFITSHVVISGMCLIKKYCYLGVNVSIRDNIVLEEGSVIGMGSSVTKNTEGNAIYMGIPAKFYKQCDDSIIL